MINPSLIVRCEKRPDIRYARLTKAGTQLIVEYGNVSMGSFVAFESEKIGMLQNPELLPVWDGNGWDLGVLADLITHLDCYNYEVRVEL